MKSGNGGLYCWLLSTLRLQPATPWQALLPNLATLPFSRLLTLLPSAQPQPPALLTQLLPIIGWRGIEQAQGEWLEQTLFAIPLATRRAHPHLTLLEAWVELEITKHSERARAALEQLDPSSLDTQGQQVAQLLFAITDFHFDDAASALKRLTLLPSLSRTLAYSSAPDYAMSYPHHRELTPAQQILDAQFAYAESDRPIPPQTARSQPVGTTALLPRGLVRDQTRAAAGQVSPDSVLPRIPRWIIP